MTTLKIPVRTVYDGSNNPIGLAEFQVGEVVPFAHGGTSANTVAQARINLLVDDANIRKLISVTGAGTYNNTTGVINITGGVTSVAGAEGDISNAALLAGIVETGYLTTANVAEVTNLYFTQERARDSVSATGSISYDNTTGIFSFTQGNSDTVVEGVTNLYFTNARARAAFTAGSGIQIEEGVISVADTLDYGLIDGAVTSSNDYGSI